MTAPSDLARRARRLVNLDDFADAGAPVRISALELHCPEARQYILRMPVRVDGGEFLLPDELSWLQEMFFIALSWQQDVLRIDHPFCYITVRHGLVESQTDDEWHVDGFSTRIPHGPEQNYIWCSEAGTEHVPLKVCFPADFDPLRHNINEYLSRFADCAKIQQCNARTIYCLDPYILHRRPRGTSGLMRTFVRISFVPIEINDINNTKNLLIPRVYSGDGVAYRNRLINYTPQLDSQFAVAAALELCSR